MAIITDRHNPSWAIFPVNNNTTAWRPFGLPMVLVIPHRRDISGNPIPNSGASQVRISIEGAPTEALVAGPDHIGLRYPDHELYARTLSATDVLDRQINVVPLSFTKPDGSIADIYGATEGDTFEYLTSSGTIDTLEFIPDADYYDLSDILIETELLPSRHYQLIYSCNYFKRIIVIEQPGVIEELLCIDTTTISLASHSFSLNHPGEIIEEAYRLTPPYYLTASSKALDTTLDLYRPFASVLQDAFDEQSFLGKMNWVYTAPYEAIPYLSAILGWDAPYFPQSLDQLRRAVLRQTTKLQQLKGSKRALTELMALFGYTILVNNLWYSKDGKRFIAPGDAVPQLYQDQQITFGEVCQLEPLLAAYTTSGFGQLSIPLLFRPQYLSGADPFKAANDSGNITIDAYLVATGSAAAQALDQLVVALSADPTGGYITSYQTDGNGVVTAPQLYEALVDADIIGYSQLSITQGQTSDITLAGAIPPLCAVGVKYDKITNYLSVTFNGSVDLTGNAIYAFATYKRQDIVVPPDMAGLQSNRFNIQLLSTANGSVVDSDILDFLLDFIYRIKAFHSLLNVVQYAFDMTEGYQVTDIAVGGDVMSRYDTGLGRQQVPPAIIPKTPTAGQAACADLSPDGLGYKPSDILYRQALVAAFLEEFAAWHALDGRPAAQSDYLNLAVSQPIGADCQYNHLGQNRTADAIQSILSFIESPEPEANQLGSGNSGDISLLRPGHLSGNNALLGNFSRDTNNQRSTACSLDGKTDYVFQGRVADEIIYRLTPTLEDAIWFHGCGIGLGSGAYWTYPTPTVAVILSTEHPSDSYVLPTVYSGGARHFTDNCIIQSNNGYYLAQPYNAALPPVANSFLGRLLRAYGEPTDESIHFSNRPYLTDFSQSQQLALQRPSLNVNLPFMHFPGCRFPSLNKLQSDFVHPLWRAKPWDEPYCLDQPGCNGAPTWLNGHLVDDTGGNQILEFDDAPFVVAGNGLEPDISSLGTQQVTSFYALTDVVHAIYMDGVADGHPAISMDNVNAVPSDTIVVTKSLFSSARPQSGNFLDFAAGYPATTGFQPLPPADLGRGGLYNGLIAAMGVPDEPTGQTQVLFLLGSGIMVGTGYRLDCGHLDVSNPDDTYDLGSGDDDAACLSTDLRLVVDDTFGGNSYTLDGSIPSLLEVVSI